MLQYKDLHNYQLVSTAHIVLNYFCGLFLEMGLGKTVATLTAIKRLIYEELEVDRVLVIAPKRVAAKVWSDELAKWSHLQGLTISKVMGNEKQRLAALAVRADIYILGRDNTAWLCGQYGGSMLPFDMLVIDESSSFKNAKSLRFKALKKTQPSFDRVVILTGTPAPKSLIDLWPQLFLLDRGERLGQTIGAYRREFFTPGASKGHVVFNYKLVKGSEARIHAAIGDIVISMKSEDYLELPGRIENIINIDFPPALQKKYNEFEKEMVLQLFGDYEEGVTIPAVNAAALSIKLRQFANGAIYDEDKNVHEIHTLKLDALEEIIEEAQGQPVLVAWTFKHDRDRIIKRFGGVNLKTNQDIDDWNAGEIPLMLMHPASGGHGLNLQAGGHIIVMYGQDWDLELDQQFIARLDRQGQREVVVLNRFVARGTIERDVVKSTDRKAANQEGLMQAVKARIEKYLK